MRILAVLLMLASAAYGQTNTPTATPTSTPTQTPTATYTAPATPHCVGAKRGGALATVDVSLTGTTEVNAVVPSSDSSRIVLQSLCLTTSGATIVTMRYEQPYEAIAITADFAAAGSTCLDVAGRCLPAGKRLLLDQSGAGTVKAMIGYSED